MNRLRAWVGMMGCMAISLSGCASSTQEPPPPVEETPPTWNKDIQPLVRARCQGCHQPNGVAPFSLTTFEVAQARHESLAASVQSRRMPPWMPALDCQSFQDSRALTAEEIDLVTKWSAAGAPLGDPADATPEPAAPPGLARVDVTLQPPEAYVPNGAVTDDYHCFILDPALQTEKDVVGFDIQPGATELVHHVLLYSVERTQALARQNQQPGLGWTCYGGPDVPGSTVQVVGGWVPGSPVTNYPTNTGVPLNKEQVLVMQVHYNLSHPGHDHATAPAPDLTTVKLQYADGRVPRPAFILPLLNDQFYVPKNSTGTQAVAVSQPYPLPATIWGLLPHMHTKGKKLRVERQDGTCLVDIPQWDFHWQQFYFYQAPVVIPAFSTVKLTCTWDNPTDKAVTWGEGTDDEMCLNYFYFTVP